MDMICEVNGVLAIWGNIGHDNRDYLISPYKTTSTQIITKIEECVSEITLFMAFTKMEIKILSKGIHFVKPSFPILLHRPLHRQYIPLYTEF